MWRKLVVCVILMVMISQPGSSLWMISGFDLCNDVYISFWSLSIALNVILTVLIAGRLLYLRKQIRWALGSDHCQVYTSISAIVIESAAINTGFTIVYITLYALHNPRQNVVGSLTSITVCAITLSFIEL